MANAKNKKIKLTPIREAFCQHYTKHWNAARAAREAGYRGLNQDILGYQLLQKTLVKERIAELTEHALNEIGVTRERILKELATIAFTNMSDLATWNDSGVRFKSSDEIGDDIKAAISEVTETVTNAGGTLRIKQHDKTKALELLGKYKKIFTDKQEISGPEGKPIETRIDSSVPDDQLDARIKAMMDKIGAKDV